MKLANYDTIIVSHSSANLVENSYLLAVADEGGERAG